MSDVRPFRGLRFARDPQSRLAPPYDTIYDDDRARLAAETENVVHLTLPPGEEGARDYDAARDLLARWIEDGVLVRDAKPALYVLEEQTTDGRLRRGFVAAVRLHDYEDNVILRHELTMDGPKNDRLLLTRATRANLEPLFFLYEDRENALAKTLDAAVGSPPLVACDGPDGTGLRLHALEDPAAIETARAFLRDRPLIIADGHHRYETMRTYRDERRDEVRASGSPLDPEAPWEFVMAYVVNAFDTGSRIQAIHRLLRSLDEDAAHAFRETGFTLEALDAGLSAEALVSRLEAQRAKAHAFVLVFPDGELALATRPRGETLDVQVLHDELLQRLGNDLEFDSKPARLLDTVRAGKAALGLLMNPTGNDELFRVVQAGAVLPRKSTFFSPKIPSGLVLRELA